MTVEYKFSIGDEVNIIALETLGRVVALYTGRRGNEVQVRYCYNGKFEDIYFFEDELEA